MTEPHCDLCAELAAIEAREDALSDPEPSKTVLMFDDGTEMVLSGKAGVMFDWACSVRGEMGGWIS